jgi:polyferredoxin
MGQHQKLLKFRKFMMFLLVLILPITFNWMSPVLIIMGGFDGYITISFVVFAVWLISSLFVGRAYCVYSCQWGAA